jgi:hypothetical protein
MHLLATYTHDWELQVIAAPLLISTVHKSPQHPLSIFPTCCVFMSHPLAMALIVEIIFQQWRFFSFSAHAIAHWLILLTTALDALNCPGHNILARTT